MRTVVVGASSGLGRSIATGLGQRGATVALLARRHDRLVDAAKEAGPGALAIVCDVTDEAAVRGALRRHRPAVVVNCAAWTAVDDFGVLINPMIVEGQIHGGVAQGVGELDQEKLGDLLQLKYHTVSDAADQLGGVPAIRDTFVGFQQYLYE